MPELPDLLDDALLRDVLATGLARGADFAEVYAESRRGRLLRLEDGRVEQLSSGRDLGAGVRVISGDRIGYAYTNVLSRDALQEAARVAAGAVQGTAEKTVADLTSLSRRADHPVRVPPLEVERPELVGLAERVDASARGESGDIAQVIVTYQGSEREILVANSEGRLADDHQTRTRLSAQVVAARNGRTETGFYGPGTSGGHELFDQYTPESIGRTAAARAATMLDAEPAPTGEMPVVLWRGDAGVLFHEACGHGMEGDHIARDTSIYASRAGEQVASPLLNGVDDATVQNGWGSFAFDDEGTPAQRTVMFADGVLTDFLLDRRSAHGLGASSSGNGRRQSYQHLPVPRMTNSHILPGEGTPDEAIAGLDRGILCKGLGGGQVNPASGDFVFGMTEAYLVEGGEIRHAIRGANLVGNGIDALRDIDMICSDFAVRWGICGKGGQQVPVSFGTPTLRISRMTIGGTA